MEIIWALFGIGVAAAGVRLFLADGSGVSVSLLRIWLR